jgi:hypothetical protein
MEVCAVVGTRSQPDMPTAWPSISPLLGVVGERRFSPIRLE